MSLKVLGVYLLRFRFLSIITANSTRQTTSFRLFILSTICSFEPYTRPSFDSKSSERQKFRQKNFTAYDIFLLPTSTPLMDCFAFTPESVAC
jgi:hypothetical protein